MRIPAIPCTRDRAGAILVLPNASENASGELTIRVDATAPAGVAATPPGSAFAKGTAAAPARTAALRVDAPREAAVAWNRTRVRVAVQAPVAGRIAVDVDGARQSFDVHAGGNTL